MSRLNFTRWTLFCAMLAATAGSLCAQISIEEAEQRLRARASTRPAATQPAEIDKLRDENRRLRERVADLQQEVTVLKQSLAREFAAPAGGGPASRPASGNALQAALIGRWRGGEITAGSSYILQFDADGTYKQIFVFSDGKETGQYRAFEDSTLEMWSSKAPEDRKHNQYRLDATAEQITLTPLVIDGLDVKSARPLTLRRAE